MRIGIALFLFFSISTFAKNINLNGDFRYRHERISQTKTTTKNTKHHVDKFRLRLKGTTEINSKTLLTVRLTSGSNGITGTNATVDGSGANKGIEIDQAFAAISFSDSLTFQAGKMATSYIDFGATGLIYDLDFTPEGVSLLGNWKNGKWSYFSYSSLYRMENFFNQSDVNLGVLQLGINFKSDSWSFDTSLGYHHFSSLQGLNNTELASKKNSVDSQNKFKYGYKLVSAQLALKRQVYKFSLGTFAQAVKNQDAPSDDFGYSAGLLIGRGSFQIKSGYKWLDADAVVGSISDGDSAGDSRTDGHGTFHQMKYQVLDNTFLAASYFAYNEHQGNKFFEKIYLDLAVNF